MKPCDICNGTGKIERPAGLMNPPMIITCPECHGQGCFLSANIKLKIKMYIYFKNGNVYIYEVDNAEKAREHAEKIWTTGYRVKVGDRHEWFGVHYIDKICWDGADETYLAKKYDE